MRTSGSPALSRIRCQGFWMPVRWMPVRAPGNTNLLGRPCSSNTFRNTSKAGWGRGTVLVPVLLSKACIAFIPVDPTPLQGQDFAQTGSGVDQKPQNVDRTPILFGVACRTIDFRKSAPE